MVLPTNIDSERWLPIPGFGGYEVSDFGRVRSWRPCRGEPLPRVRRLHTAKAGGYATLGMQHDGHETTEYVHHLVLLAFVGPRPQGQEIRHLDGDPGNNRLSNLAYGSTSENAYDRVAH